MKKIEYYGNKNAVSQKVKYYRRKRRLTQKELVARMQSLSVNLDQQAISKIERNKRFVTEYELVCFCVALDVSLNDMLQDFYTKYGRIPPTQTIIRDDDRPDDRIE